MRHTYNEGRIFISPIIGCNGGCKYCYLPEEISNFNIVRKNTLYIQEIINAILEDKNFVQGKNGTIISIGAYCDIFPRGDMGQFIEHSVQWIIECLKIGNPVQIISKNVVNETVIRKIADNIQYKNQLLFSTTITTFTNWENIEPFSATPKERISSLNMFKKYNIPTNLMIKPFIPGVTDKDIDEFKKVLQKNNTDYVVVGELYVLNNIMSSEFARDKLKNNINVEGRILDCTGGKRFKTVEGKKMDNFIEEISRVKKKIFRKSSCINANILGINNKSGYYEMNSNGYCINCGNCIR